MVAINIVKIKTQVLVVLMVLHSIPIRGDGSNGQVSITIASGYKCFSYNMLEQDIHMQILEYQI